MVLGTLQINTNGIKQLYIISRYVIFDFSKFLRCHPSTEKEIFYFYELKNIREIDPPVLPRSESFFDKMERQYQIYNNNSPISVIRFLNLRLFNNDIILRFNY
jgi:hypothetical protein